MDERGPQHGVVGAAFGTTEEVAHLVGVNPLTVTGWVKRGQLEPLNPGQKPSRFRVADVIECALERMRKPEHDRIDALWSRLLASERENLP